MSYNNTPKSKNDYYLSINREILFLPTSNHPNEIIVSWNFESPTNMLDWVGLYRIEEKNPLYYLSYQQIKSTTCSLIIFKLKYESIIQYSTNYTFIFRYYDGITGSLRATSPQFCIFSHARLVVHELSINGQLSLKKQHSTKSCFGKIYCGNFSYRTLTIDRINNDEEFVWKNLKFLFPVDCSKDLTIEILKEEHLRKNKILGVATIPFLDLINSAQNRNLVNYTCHLRKHIIQEEDTKIHSLKETCHSSNIACLTLTIQIIVENIINKQENLLLSSNNNILTNSLMTSMNSKKDEEKEKILVVRKNITSDKNANTIMAFKKNTDNQIDYYNGTKKFLLINNSQSSSISSGVSSLSESSTSSSKSSTDIISNLPKGFEARIDKVGRIFYIDHINKKTTWTLPNNYETKPFIDINNRKLHTNDLFMCTRRTTVNSSSTNLQPALTFLQRSDFLNILQTNTTALERYNSSSYLKHMITRIRKKDNEDEKNDMYYYEKFSKNKELINFVNLFADKTQPLPSDWTTINIPTKFYINHKTKQTTAIDPRLPVEIKKRPRSEEYKKVNNVDASLTKIYENINEIKELVKEHYPQLSDRMCKKLNLISKVGETALLRFANDLDIITAISLYEEKKNERNNQYNKIESEIDLDFKEKVNYFYSTLSRNGYGTGPTKIKLLLRRFFLVEDSFTKILSIDNTQLRKSQLNIIFEDEDGLDYGGPSRELFFLLSRDLFNPYYGLFEYSNPNVYTVTIARNSKKVKNYLKWFELCGRVLGLALIHRCLIDTFFPKPFYKLLLNTGYVIEDLKDMDIEYYNSLKWISENNINDIEFTFTATTTINGKNIDIDLLPDGNNLYVTEYNKDQYINLLLKHRIERNIEEQIKALKRGLYDIIDSNYLRVFSPSQLSLLLSGSMDIDLEDWRENTEYKGGYFDSHVVINWFWNVVYNLTNAERLKLLKFVTGTSSIPFEGFKGLRGSNGGLKKFTIEKWGESNSLPRAHTCFNRLDLPLYKDQQIIKNKLLLAINESDSYAIE
uniref:HECT-type E3 ubiquitin transferase n=2 Tax=Strongyloides stercoralis TaxID=6248 RepID=A0AAF5D8R1_STRER